MNHLTEEQILDAFYEDAAVEDREHLQHCPDCRARLKELTEVLAPLGYYSASERGEAYGQEVWNRLTPQLDLSQRKSKWLVWPKLWMFAPAVAALLAIAFLAGIWTEHRRTTDTFGRERERVLLMAISDHLEQSQIVLAELLHAAPGSQGGAAERERARNLLEENRLLRQTATHLGDRAHAALLDDLERVLVDLANSPADLSSEDLKLLQQRVEDNGLLWKVRVTSTDAREKGQKL